MQAGRLGDWIIFQKKAYNTDQTVYWVEDFGTWAEFQPLSANSIQTNLDQTDMSQLQARFLIRFRRDVHSTTHRISFDSKIWNILEPIPDRKRTMLTIDAQWTDPPE